MIKDLGCLGCGARALLLFVSFCIFDGQDESAVYSV